MKVAARPAEHNLKNIRIIWNSDDMVTHRPTFLNTMLVKQNLFVKQDLLYKMAHNQVIQKYKISFGLQF